MRRHVLLRSCMVLFFALLGNPPVYACDRAIDMLDAIASDSMDILESILKSGESPNCTGPDDDTLLGAAVTNRNIPAIKMLLKYKADVNQTEGGISPLYDAALANCVQCANLLIAAGGKFIADELQVKSLRRYKHINDSPFWKRIIEGAGWK